jgi:hypothetical protein
MRSLIGVAVGVVVALVFGCGPAKELPEATPEAKTAIKPAEVAVKSTPKDSPEARKVVDRGVRAITQNHPELLKKAEISRVNTHGRIKLPNNQSVTMAEADRDVFAIWPDQMRVVYNFKDNSTPKLTFVLHNEFGWQMSGGGKTIPTTSYTNMAQYIKINMLAEHWFLMGLGFNEPEEVIYDPITDKTVSGSTTSVKVKLKDRAVLYTVTFNDQSGLPVRVAYEPREFIQKVNYRKEIVAKEHKDFGGLLLPGVLETLMDGDLAERWTIDAWDFPSQLPDSLFLQPKAGE